MKENMLRFSKSATVAFEFAMVVFLLLIRRCKAFWFYFIPNFVCLIFDKAVK